MQVAYLKIKLLFTYNFETAFLYHSTGNSQNLFQLCVVLGTKEMLGHIISFNCKDLRVFTQNSKIWYSLCAHSGLMFV